MNSMSVEEERQFVDTNVLVYTYDLTAAVKQARAEALLSELWHSGQGCLSIQVLQEFFAVTTRKIRQILPPDKAAAVVSDMAQWRVHSPVAADVLAVIELAERHRISYWDASIIVSAQRLGCRTLWSEDLQDGGVYGDVVVRNPFGRTDVVQEPITASPATRRRGATGWDPG